MSIFDGVRRAFGLGGNEEAAEPGDHDQQHAHDDGFPAEQYARAIEAQRANKDLFFKQDRHSPLTQRQRDGFEGLSYYPPNLALRFELPLERHETPETITFQTSTGAEQEYENVGEVRFEVEGQTATLQVYEPTEGGEYFLPFRDATSGKETYGAGRYLEPHVIGEDELLVDFNLAYNPYCAYNDAWSCPLPPIPNWLKVPIRAGEKLSEGEWAGHEELLEQGEA